MTLYDNLGGLAECREFKKGFQVLAYCLQELPQSFCTSISVTAVEYDAAKHFRRKTTCVCPGLERRKLSIWCPSLAGELGLTAGEWMTVSIA